MKWFDYEAMADQWEAEQEAIDDWEAQEAQYTEDRKNFLEAMDALYTE